MATKLQAKSEIINTVIMLPDGRVAVKRPMSANQFFEFQKQIQTLGQEAAEIGLYMQAYQINGENLTPDDIESLSFDDLAALDTGATNIEDAIATDEKSITESDSLQFADGRLITRKKLPANSYFKFKRLMSQNQLNAFKWAMLEMFLVNGEAISEESLSKLPPEGLGFSAASLLVTRIASLFSQPQVTKKSSGFAKLPDGH